MEAADFINKVSIFIFSKIILVLFIYSAWQEKRHHVLDLTETPKSRLMSGLPISTGTLCKNKN